MARFRVKRKAAFAGGLALLLIIGFLTGYPLLMLVYGSFRTGAPGLPGSLTLDGYINAYQDAQTYQTWLNSLILAGAVTTISTLLVLFFAWVVARTDTPGRHLILPMMTMIFATPSIFPALGWAMLAAPRAGLLNYLVLQVLPLPGPPFAAQSWPGMIFVMSLHTVPFKFLLLLGAFLAMDKAMEEASRLSGAGRVKTFFLIGLPMLAPTILGVAILSFVRGLQAFDVPVFLGLPARIYVFSTRIYDYLGNFSPARYAEACALALSLVVTMLALVILQWKYLGNREFITVSGKGYRPDVWRLGHWRYVCVALVVLYGLLAFVLPLVQMVIGSLQGVYGLYIGPLTLRNYETALASPIVRRAISNTILVAGVAGFLTMVLTTLVAYVVARSSFALRRPLDLLTWLPWTMPGIVLGLGMLWAYLSVPGLKLLYGTVWLLMLGVIVTVIPVGVRVMAGGFGQVSRDLEESARVHGAGWGRAFVGILLWITAPSFLNGWLVVSMIIGGELAVPLLLYTPGSELLSIAVFSYYTRGETAVAAAIFCLMLASIAIAFTVAWLIGRLVRWIVSRGAEVQQSPQLIAESA